MESIEDRLRRVAKRRFAQIPELPTGWGDFDPPRRGMNSHVHPIFRDILNNAFPLPESFQDRDDQFREDARQERVAEERERDSADYQPRGVL